MKKMILGIVGGVAMLNQSALAAEGTMPSLEISYTKLAGLVKDPDGYNRRDNSDIIKVGDLYYVWYSKMNQRIKPTVSNIWYATSKDGKTWEEKGQSLTSGEAGAWDERVVYTPGILVAEDKYYLFYTGQQLPENRENPEIEKPAIGVAVSSSPDGPWEKMSAPVIKPSDDPSHFDSRVCDDASLVMKNGKYWLYYKGRQMGKSPRETHMGVAISEKPEGPYMRSEQNPLIGGNHEVLVWRHGKGVATLIGNKANNEKLLKPYVIHYAEDGLNFTEAYQLKSKTYPWAAGAYRPEAFTNSDKGTFPKWGLHIGGKRPDLFLERYDLISAEGE